MKSLKQLAAEYVVFTKSAREAEKALTDATKAELEKATTREECFKLCTQLPRGSQAWALAHDKGFRLTIAESARQFTTLRRYQP